MAGKEKLPRIEPVGEVERFFDIALDMLCIADHEGYFRRINPAFTSTLGWSLEELCAKPFIEFVHPEDVEATLAELERQTKTGQPVFYFENRYRHKDGGYRVLAWKSIPKPDGFLYAVAHDVTELREHQRELMDKNADLEQFSRAVAHDLRAPLRAISGYSEILSHELDATLSAEAKEDFGRIRANVERMTRMIDGLLRFSRAGIQELDKKHVDVDAMVRSSIAELNAQLKGRRVEFVLGELPNVHADPEMCRIVFSNLLSNAVKFTRLKEKARIEVGAEKDGGRPVFYVRDNGAGFDIEHADKLFRVFERMHPVSSYEGYGIGLAAVQRIVQRHGGKIWAEGRENEGATFFFTL